MYTPDQYSRAKAQVAGAPPEAQAILKRRIGEYERYNPSHNAPSEGLHAQSGEDLPPVTAEAPKVPVEHLSHESAPIPQQGALESEGLREAPTETPDIVDETRDEGLHTASKLKALARPAEVVAARPLAGLAHVAAALVADPLHPLANSYYEPSEQQFLNEQGALLGARGVQPGTPAFRDAFDEYKDRKWAQAHDKAQAEGMPLTRMEYVHRDKVGWDTLKDALSTGVDTTQAFLKGFVNGRTLQGGRVLTAGSDALTGRDEAGEDAAQVERHPWANFAGEIKGASGGSLAKLTEAATPFSESTSMGARIGGAAIGGLAAGEADNASRAVATGADDLAHGRGLGNAKEQFVSHLVGSGLLGAGGGALGQSVAEGANAWQRAVLADAPELGQLRRGGGDTSILRGISPGKAVAENIEAAREPLPGEAKAMPTGSPVEIAAEKVRTPLAQAHTDLNQKTFERLGVEKQASIAGSPALQKPVPAHNSARAAVDWVKSKLQPEVLPDYLPGMKLSTAQTTPGADTGEATKLVQQLFKPRLVTSVEAAAEARANGGHVLSVEDAQKLGIQVGDLAHQPAPETGVPHDAPPIDEGAVSVPKLLPKYPKGTEAGGVAADITPDEADAIKRYTWGKREPGDADKVNNYLERAPVSPLPHVYRGLAMKPDEAADMLASGQFSTGSEPTSVSFDPTVARSFAARNRQPGDVGITLKLEHASARNISGLAHDQVGVEKELILPGNRNFEVVSKHQDPANPGDWIVVARETDAPAVAGSTIKDVFGTPADKVSKPTGAAVTESNGRFSVDVGSPRFKEGMRDDSFSHLRAHPEDANRQGIPRIEVYPDSGPTVADGRHRMALAAERGEGSIDAEVVRYDADGNVVSRETQPVALASPVDRLKPRLGRAKPPPAPTPGSDWERPAFERGKFDFIYHDHATPDPFAPPAGDDVTPTRPSNSPPVIERRAVSRGAPSSAPPELRAQPSPQAATAREAGVPLGQMKVVLEPREYDAAKFEEILGDIDRKAGYAKANGAPDPQWEKLAQAIREDRKQFGPGWTDLIAKHHDELNRLEQRSFHAGLAEDKAYPEMRGGAQQRLQGKLKGFPGDSDSNRALREIAASAPPEVQRDLEVLGAQNAYAKLKGQANPKLGESLGPSGVVGHLRGLGPAVKFRADALARGLSAGPTGQPTITPRLAQFVREQVPSPSWIPGLGGGALGLRAAVAYDALTPQQQAFLDKLVATVRPNEQAGVSQ